LTPKPLTPKPLTPKSVTHKPEIEITLLGIATVKAIQCRCPVATRQLLREVAGYEDKLSTKLIHKIHSSLDWKSRQWLKHTILPGLGSETLEQAASRIHRQYQCKIDHNSKNL
jgi:hypothetical protein